MKKHPKKITLVLGIVIFLLCSIPVFSITSLADDEGRKLKIYTVNYPLQYFAKRVGGDNVEVYFPAPSDVDPAYWTPGREIIQEYQSADLILLNGADYAKWVNKVTLPKSKLVDTSRSFKSDYIALKETVTHSHGPGGEHSHTGVAFTTWLDPLLAIQQAEAVKHALTELMPEKKEILKKNFDSLKMDLEELNNKLQNIFSTDPNKPLLASHPVYQYLARRYDLNLRSLHWEPDQIPGPDEHRQLDAILEGFPSKLMIWEGEPEVEARIYLSEKGIDSAVFSPCSNKPAKGGYLEVMKENALNLEQAYR